MPIVRFKAGSGFTYELTLEADSIEPGMPAIPGELVEGDDGKIRDEAHGVAWNSLGEMAVALGVKITRWTSNLGD